MIKDYESTEKNYGAAGTKCPRKEKKKKLLQNPAYFKSDQHS